MFKIKGIYNSVELNLYFNHTVLSSNEYLLLEELVQISYVSLIYLNIKIKYTYIYYH
jgi:hypothetical protein